MERFVEAMATIRQEIDDVIAGDLATGDSPLKHAPHTASTLIDSGWDRAYPRETGAFPVERLRIDKYFPPVGRIDGAYGDRNLVCSCPPMEEYQ